MILKIMNKDKIVMVTIHVVAGVLMDSCVQDACFRSGTICSAP